MVSGPGSAEQVPRLVKDMGARKVMLVTTEGRLSSGAGRALVSQLGRALGCVYAGVRPNAPTTAVREAVARATSEEVDGVVSFGGGSCVEVAKAACFFAEQQAGAPGVSYLDRPIMTHLAIPTTYTGSELNGSFGMTDSTTGRTTCAKGPTTAPVCVVYDAALTADLPVRVAAETGMCAIANGIECVCAPAASPEVEVVALASLSRAASALPELVDDPSDQSTRSRMLTASMLAARALQNSTAGLVHALGQLTAGRTGISHGLASALLLEPVVRFYAEREVRGLSAVAHAMGGDAGDLAGDCARLRERVGLGESLRQHGVTEDDVDAVARMSQGHPAVCGAAAPVGEADVRELLSAAL